MKDLDRHILLYTIQITTIRPYVFNVRPSNWRLLMTAENFFVGNEAFENERLKTIVVDQ